VTAREEINWPPTRRLRWPWTDIHVVGRDLAHLPMVMTSLNCLLGVRPRGPSSALPHHPPSVGAQRERLCQILTLLLALPELLGLSSSASARTAASSAPGSSARRDMMGA